MSPCVLPPGERPELPAWFAAGCHCGAVRLRVRLSSYRATECNCTICTMKGFLHLLVEAADVELLSPPDAVTTYRFGTGVAGHHFCPRCGQHPYYVPRSNPAGYSVNARCLDGAPLEWFERVPFDGRNWERAIRELR